MRSEFCVIMHGRRSPYCEDGLLNSSLISSGNPYTFILSFTLINENLAPKTFWKLMLKKVFRSFKCTLLVLQNMKSEWGRIKCQGFATLPSRQNIKNVWNFSYQSQSMSLTKEISHLFCRVQSLYLYKKLFAHIYTYIY